MRLHAWIAVLALALACQLSGPAVAVAAPLPAPSTLKVDSFPDRFPFGGLATLTATVGPGEATGTVTVTAIGDTGPKAGQPVVVGTGSLFDGVAVFAIGLPAFGDNRITVRYGGDAAHAPAQVDGIVMEQIGYPGELIINEVRSSGPGGVDDSYLELYNTGIAIPLGDFRIQSPGVSIDLPSNAPTLESGRSFLIAGPDFSLGGHAHPDLVTPLGRGGWQVLAPDNERTRTDAVGDSTGSHSGDPLPVVNGAPTQQWAFVRRSSSGRPVNTATNRDDLLLLSTSGGSVGGVSSLRGSPAPNGLTDPAPDLYAVRSSVLDRGVGQSVAPNRIYSAGAPGQLIIMRTLRNTSDRTITAATARITSLSQAGGPPRPGGQQPSNPARLRVVDAFGGPLSRASTLARGRVWVHNLSPDPPADGVTGGGLNTTLDVPLPTGGWAPGEAVDVSFSFAVDRPGVFWFGYDLDVITTAVARPAAGRLRHPSIAAQQLRRTEPTPERGRGLGPDSAYASGRLD